MTKKFKPPSDEFMRAVVGAGSPVISCEFCGRVHFAPSTDLDTDEGELEALEKKAASNPEKYILHGDSDSILWGTLDGAQAVWDCPCNMARKYEDFVIAHRWMIGDYLQARAKRLVEEAAREQETAEQAHDALKKERVT